jgi:hypothetical protein
MPPQVAEPSDPQSRAEAVASVLTRLRLSAIWPWIVASIAVHVLWVLPWARILVALLRLLGMPTGEGPLQWKDVDGPVVIPIEIDDLDEGRPQAATFEGPIVAPGDPAGAGPGAGIGLDAGADASDDSAGGDAGGGDAEAGPRDAGRKDAGDTGGDPDGATDAGPKRIRDPIALSGGLDTIKASDVHVSILVRLDHLRAHPLGPQIGAKLSKIPQWAPFFQGTGIDPIRDLDAITAKGPRFHETSKVSTVVAHNKPDEVFASVLEGMTARIDGATKVEADDLLAIRAKIDGAERILVQLPGGLLIHPATDETTALATARALWKSKKRMTDRLPKSDKDLIFGFSMSKPSNVLTAIPEDLHDVRGTVRALPDGGGALDVEAKAKDAAHAKSGAEALRKIVEGYVPKGGIGVIARPYVRGYTIEAEDDYVRLHHELDGERVQSLWTLLSLGGF